jgi:hypothetical protein
LSNDDNLWFSDIFGCSSKGKNGGGAQLPKINLSHYITQLPKKNGNIGITNPKKRCMQNISQCNLLTRAIASQLCNLA